MAERESKQYFRNFLEDENNKDLLSALRSSVLGHFRYGSNACNVTFLRILKSNATDFCDNYSDAALEVEEIRDESGVLVTAPITVFFAGGYGVLRDFLDETPKLPEDSAKRQSLKDLLQFLKSASGNKL